MFEDTELTISQALEDYECAYLICECKDGDYIHGEIQRSDYWVGGDEGGFTNDANIFFNTSIEAERWYNKEYVKVFVYTEEYERDEAWDESGLEW